MTEIFKFKDHSCDLRKNDNLVMHDNLDTYSGIQY